MVDLALSCALCFLSYNACVYYSRTWLCQQLRGILNLIKMCHTLRLSSCVVFVDLPMHLSVTYHRDSLICPNMRIMGFVL